MISVNPETKKIDYSLGDEFYLEATIKNYTPSAGDTFHLAIRSAVNTTPLVTLQAVTSTTTEGYIKCIFSAASLSALSVNDYMYDIYVQGTGKKTFMFVAQFSVRMVAHNV